MDATVTGMHQLRHVLGVSFIDSMTLLFRSIILSYNGIRRCFILGAALSRYAPLVPQMSEKRLRDISLVGVQFAEHLVCQRVND